MLFLRHEQEPLLQPVLQPHLTNSTKSMGAACCVTNTGLNELSSTIYFINGQGMFPYVALVMCSEQMLVETVLTGW